MMTGRECARLHFFSFARATPDKGVTEAVRILSLINGVDTLLTWMILMQALWLQPRFSMTMTRLANWFADSIRWSRKWSEPIDRDALLKRTFLK
jgi:hypothetical protein